MLFYHMDQFNDRIRRQCECGGEAEVLLAFADDFAVRCKRCHRSTQLQINLEDALAQWESQDKLIPSLDLITDNLEFALNRSVQFIAIAKEGAECLNAQSCDCDKLIVVTDEDIIWMKSDSFGGMPIIGFDTLISFNPEVYSLIISPPKAGEWTLLRIEKNDRGDVISIKYQYGDRFLFIFASQYNLIVTKSVVDLLDSEDVPDVDDSILFEA